MDTLEQASGIENIESEVEERLEVFVRAYVSEFEKKLEEYAIEAEVGGTGKTGKMSNALSAAASSISGLEWVVGPAEKCLKSLDAKYHRKKAKKVTQIFQTVKPDERKRMFVEAAVLLYYSFQNQFNSVTDADDNWINALSKLAIDARNRSISYLYNEATEALSTDLLTKAVTLGKSKDSFISRFIPKKKQQIIPGSKPGYTVKKESEDWKTSDIYEQVGIRIVGSNGQTKYYKKKMCGHDFGYRWSFNWENDGSWISNYTEEDCSNVPDDPRTSLKLEELESKIVQILANMNMEDSKWLAKDNKLQYDRIEDGVDMLKADIAPIKQDLHEIKKKLSLRSSKNDQPKIFNVTSPVKTFTGRERELTLLHDKLQTQHNQVVVSQCASISGLGGMGKSELARKYAHTYHEFYGSCIWIDSETQSSIKQSFHRSAEKLQIPIKQKSSDGERNILHIVEDIYKRFSNSKSLFIFDNVNQFEEIEDFMPSDLSPTDEKPTIIITSRNSDWDIGDEGDVGLILLDQFTPEEALSFVKKVLDIKDEDKSHDSSISELTEELCYFPLALRQAASYIKAKKFLNSAIENYLAEFRDEKRGRDLLKYKLKRDRYTETTYTTWQTTFRNMEKNEVNGLLATRLVEVMAYLAADDIPLIGFINLATNEEKFTEAVDILVKYSIITVKEDQEEYDEERDEEIFFYDWHVAIHRLVQQVIRLWLQDGTREEDVLRTALTQIHDSVPDHHRAALWSFACKYTALIDNYFCKIYKKHTFYNKIMFPLTYLVEDGDVHTIKTVFDYLEGMNDLWNDLSSHILDSRLVECRHNDPDMENTGHETHIKTLVLFHAEVYKALKHSNTEDLELFLQSFDKSLINSWFVRRTALERSAESGNLNVVKTLVENGADVTFPNDLYSNALQIVLFNNHPHLAEYLLDHGAVSNVTENKGWTELESACYHGNLNIVKHLVGTTAKCENCTNFNWKLLPLAAQGNHLEIVEFLINHEVYHSQMRDHGQNLCSVAARNGSIQVFKYLIDNKSADVNGRDRMDETLLFVVVNKNQFDMVEYLLSDETHDKVDINAYNVWGYTPLFRAVLRGNVQIARFLIEHGAAVDNVQNGHTLLGQFNISALHLAAAYNHIEMVKLLTEESNADINRGLKTSFSPLQVAKFFDNKEVCDFLIKKHAHTTEWSDANSDNITRIIRSFIQENNSPVDEIFRECNLVLDYINDYNQMHFYEPSLLKKRLNILRSFLNQCKLSYNTL